jgi:hypothetical protein
MGKIKEQLEEINDIAKEMGYEDFDLLDLKQSDLIDFIFAFHLYIKQKNKVE